jgi:ribonuclease III
LDSVATTPVLRSRNIHLRSCVLRFFASIFRKRKASERELKEAIRNIFGYQPGNIALYRLAFKHKSMATSVTNGFRHSNERLEYLGDAVLGSIVADFLFKKFPYKDEGFLTEMRSRIVSRSNLNSLSRKLGIDRLVEASKDNNVTHSSILGDAFEALVGAVYLDKGYRFAQHILINQVIQTHLDIDELLTTEINFKSKIIEWAQKEKKAAEFILVEELGNGKKSKLYVVSLVIEGQEYGQGRDFSIKKAEQQAARLAWEKMFEES